MCLSFIYFQWRILEKVTKNARHYIIPQLYPGSCLNFALSKEIRNSTKERKQEESSNSILPCGRVCWKQEPKGVITYTPKSDMTIHLGVVAAGGGEAVGGRRGVADLLTVWLLTVSLGWLVRISLCVSAIDARQIKISTIADRQTLVELGFGFSFPFILKNCSSANFTPKCGVTARGLQPREKKLYLL